MSRFALAIASVLMVCSAASAAEVWKATFDSGPDGAVDVYDDNANNTMIGPAAGGTLQVKTWDASYPSPPLYAPNTDRAGLPLGVAVNGHNEFSALYTFRWSALNESQTNAWEFAGFLGSGGTNPGIARGGWIGATMRHSKNAAGEYRLNLGSHWATSYGNDRYLAAPSITIAPSGSDPYNKTFQLAISYQGDYLGDTGAPYLQVDLYDAAGNLLSSTSGIANSGSINGLLPWGTDPVAKEAALTANVPTHLGWGDYATNQNAHSATWEVDSLAFYDSFDGALSAVAVPEPAAILLLAPALLAMGRRRRRGIA